MGLLTHRNGWYAFPIDVVSPKYASLDALRAAKGYGCDKWNDNGLCEGGVNLNFVTWWSPTTHRAYTFDQNLAPDRQSNPKPLDLMQKIVKENWATLEVLFDGSFNCTWQGKARNPPTVDVGDDGKLQIGCISRLEQKRRADCGYCFPGSYLFNGKECAFTLVPKPIKDACRGSNVGG